MGDITAVLFDWGGVFTNPPLVALREIEKTLGYAHRQLVDWLFYSGMSPDPGGVSVEGDFHLLEKGAIAIEEFHTRVLARSAEYLGDPMTEETYASLCELFVTNPGIDTVHWVMLERARRLRRDGYRTAIVTNQIASWRELWRTSVPLEDFDVIVDSCEVGMRKPEPAILQLACDRLGVRPEQAVLLDDSLRNIAGARAFGMAAIHVQDPLQAIAELDAMLYSSSSSDSRSIA
jgi:epoxide hydrolase-like predicted phosphatase